MNFKDTNLYPMELSLTRVKKSWGGWPGRIGEIWSLSCRPYESLILNGVLSGQTLRDTVGIFQQRLLGKDMELDPREPFPLLLKIISTARDLPIQVHPNDAYTLDMGLPMVGRDKIFYILGAKPGANIYSGFSTETDKKQVMEAINSGSLLCLMNRYRVTAGDVFTIPAGRIHAIGKGITLVEIQRHSDLTFNISSHFRKDINDIMFNRSLMDALKIIDLNPLSLYPVKRIAIDYGDNQIELLGLTPHFFLRKFNIYHSMEFSVEGKRFIIYTVIRGSGSLRWGISGKSIFIQPGQSVLVPAIKEDILFESDDVLEILETTAPDLTGETIKKIVCPGITLQMLTGLGGEDYGNLLKGCLT